MIEMYKVYHEISPECVLRMFDKVAETHQANTRFALAGNFVIPRVRLKQAKGLSDIEGPKLGS